MRGPRLFWKLFAALTAITLGLAALLVFVLSSIHTRFIERAQRSHLETLSGWAIDELEPLLEPGARAQLSEAARRLDGRTGARITVILPGGEVIADSRRGVAFMETHAGRPEVLEALGGRTGHARRYSTSVQMRMLYVARPIPADDGSVAAVIRLALSDQALREMESFLQNRMAAAALLLVLLAAAVAAALARQLSRPLEAMRRVAMELAEGRPGEVAWPAPGTREVAELAEALRHMSGRLSAQVDDVGELLAEQRAVFESMVDGVLLVDRAGRVVEINRAAAEWFRCTAEAARGRDVLELVRHPRLGELVGRTLAGRGPVEGDLLLHGPRELHLQVHGAPVRGETGRVAAVLVLTDVTRLREMEKTHRDFVANASHELKTPVTTIKGFAETLAGEDVEPAQARRFAGIVARQADHLTSLIEDLLELTRLEHQRESGPLERETSPASALLWGAVETCAADARAKEIAVAVRCPEGLVARVNAGLVQRAVTNLIDNAIKYSPAQTTVRVEAFVQEGGLRVEVADQGPGIAPEHQTRIFERFYRVDKSRSRKLGGTGLGLSIVRHAAEAHGGSVTLRSEPGAGCTFTLLLPGACPAA